ncbi:membrane protein [Klebsiella pneumoniae]|nr:membrane protein [Klebsiella pneumoniae]
MARAFGHRGFTHSLLAVFGALTLFYLKVPDSWIVPADALQGLVLGYLSHILADMLTPAGVPLLWPCRWRFRLPILAPRKGNQLERALCMVLFVYAVWMPQTLADNSAIRWSSRGDQFPADHLQSLYKSPEWAIKRRKTPFGYNPFHLNISP